MVTHSTSSFETAYPEWRSLLAACEPYAAISGWRFVLTDFMRLDGREAAGVAEARQKAMPMALEYADRVRACIAAQREGAEAPRLLTEFQACQRHVAREAVYNSMMATITAVGLSEQPAIANAAAAASSACDPELSLIHI